MGKRIIQQARGKGSFTYRVRKKAYQHKIGYSSKIGEAEILSLIHSAGHSAPLMKLKVDEDIFFMPAFNGAVVGEKIQIGKKEVSPGNILQIKDIPTSTRVYNIEKNPGDGGKMMRSAGTSALVSKKYDHNKVGILMPNKKEVILSGDSRATIGIIAGSGKNQKPIMKAGNKFHRMRALGKLYPIISAVSVNAIDHPFGSGRGKRIKSKTAKRNAPPGKRVGHIRPRRTGKK
ncbi:50S ribosomal protein L2 [Candidatus Pacearchaeota archaeon]|nr:50S ribosomal protein L2 [Candidatus Pacearchaeota archaeon]|tara:strand:+ start:6979 stop:7674 length:696 start_codon:yes stop_codon:yes gene_type:complete